MRIAVVEPYDSTMSNRITTRMKLCGRGHCSNVDAVVDTGAEMTLVSQTAARKAGLRMTGRKMRGYGVSKTPVVVEEAEAKVCIRRSCRKQTVYVAEDRVIGDDALLGMDFMGPMGVRIDARGRKIRVRARGGRR